MGWQDSMFASLAPFLESLFKPHGLPYLVDNKVQRPVVSVSAVQVARPLLGILRVIKFCCPLFCLVSRIVQKNTQGKILAQRYIELIIKAHFIERIKNSLSKNHWLMKLQIQIVLERLFSLKGYSFYEFQRSTHHRLLFFRISLCEHYLLQLDEKESLSCVPIK